MKLLGSFFNGLVFWECIELFLIGVVYDYCFVRVGIRNKVYFWCYLIEKRMYFFIRRFFVYFKVCFRYYGFISYLEIMLLFLVVVYLGRLVDLSMYFLLGVGNWKEGLVIFYVFDENIEYLLEDN